MVLVLKLFYLIQIDVVPNVWSPQYRHICILFLRQLIARHLSSMNRINFSIFHVCMNANGAVHKCIFIYTMLINNNKIKRISII